MLWWCFDVLPKTRLRTGKNETRPVARKTVKPSWLCDCEIQHSRTSSYRLFPNIVSKYMKSQRTSKLSLWIFIMCSFNSSFFSHRSSAIRNPSVPTRYEDRYGSMSYWYYLRYLILRPSWTTPSWQCRCDDVTMTLVWCLGVPTAPAKDVAVPEKAMAERVRAPMNANDGSKLTSM